MLFAPLLIRYSALGFACPSHRGQIIIDLCRGAGKRRIWETDFRSPDIQPVLES